jgi:pyridoxal phosphate enzyme (YggS family)
MSIQSNLQFIRGHIPSTVQLVCVSKFHPNDVILEAYACGERIFGESKVQELCTKYETLPKDIEWHFIGHLQTNKIKHIVPFISLIHGVDSLKLLSEIDNHAAKIERKVNCLLQVHIATEETKFGFSPDELLNLFHSGVWKEFQNVQLCGLMGMATFTNDEAQIHTEFRILKSLFDDVKANFFANNYTFSKLSMGMSEDYGIAIEEGSTMIRVGTLIFGDRIY